MTRFDYRRTSELLLIPESTATPCHTRHTWMLAEALALLRGPLAPPPRGDDASDAASSASTAAAVVSRVMGVGEAVRCVSLGLPLATEHRELRAAWIAWAGGGGEADNRGGVGDGSDGVGTVWGQAAVAPPHRRPAWQRRRRRLCLDAWHAFRPPCNLDDPKMAPAATVLVFWDTTGKKENRGGGDEDEENYSRDEEDDGDGGSSAPQPLQVPLSYCALLPDAPSTGSGASGAGGVVPLKLPDVGSWRATRAATCAAVVCKGDLLACRRAKLPQLPGPVVVIAVHGSRGLVEVR